jgi:hypothetical protein
LLIDKDLIVSRRKHPEGGQKKRSGAMKTNRNLSRADGRRLGNAALIAFMLGSLLLLSVIRARFSPIGTQPHAWIFACANSVYCVLGSEMVILGGGLTFSLAG